MQVSVIVPTVRPNEIFKCITTIHAAVKGLDSYEIVVVADFALEGSLPNVNWIYVSERNGPVAAICKAEKECKGKYLFLISDEDRLIERTLKQLYDAAELEETRGRRSIIFPYCGALWNYYNHIFPPFPFISKKLATELGGLLLPEYGAHYADPDLGMRAYVNNVNVIPQYMIPIQHPNNMSYPDHIENRTKFYEHDKNLFRLKWNHLGEFRE